MRPRTLIAFDYGTRRIGVAVGQELTASARPLKTLLSVKKQPDWDAISRVIDEWRPDALVVGIPLNMDGSEQEMTHAARRFGARLQGRYGLPVYFADERLTTREASRQMADAGRRMSRGEQGAGNPVDAMAAQIILQSYLDDHANTQNGPSKG